MPVAAIRVADLVSERMQVLSLVLQAGAGVRFDRVGLLALDEQLVRDPLRAAMQRKGVHRPAFFCDAAHLLHLIIRADVDDAHALEPSIARPPVEVLQRGDAEAALQCGL